MNDGLDQAGWGAVPPAGPHGGDGPAIARALGRNPEWLLDLSQSLNPFAPDVAGLVPARLDSLGHYPDPRPATAALAAAIGVEPGRLLLTNGGSEAISLVAQEYGGRPAAEPDFALYPRNSAGPVWRSDPHSPSGILASETCHADIWDEAFYPLATGRWTSHRPGIVVGSLTKVFACPGLRLGYVIADDIERLARHQPLWSVGSLALALVEPLIEAADLARWQQRLAVGRARLAAVFEGHGFDLRVADAPWILVEAPGLRERLAPHGVLVRDCASFGMPGWARIAVPDRNGIDRVAGVLDELARHDP